MPAIAFQPFDCFTADIIEHVHDFSTDVFKILLTNTLPVRTQSTKAEIDELVAGNGYDAGGKVAAFVSGGQVNGIYKLVLASPVPWVATADDLGPFRYVVLYNSSVVAQPLLGWGDYGASIAPHEGESFTATLDQVNGVFRLRFNA